MDGHNAEDTKKGTDDSTAFLSTKQGTDDLTTFVQNLLQEMQGRYETMSNFILPKIGEMCSKIEGWEDKINEIRAEMGAESLETPPPASVAESEKTPSNDST